MKVDRHSLAVVEKHATSVSSDHRAVLVAAAGGATYAEMAALLGIPFGTVKSRLNRAKKALDKVLAAAAHKAPPPSDEVSRDR